MDKEEVLNPKKARLDIKSLLVLVFCATILGAGLYTYIFWQNNLRFPWQREVSSEYQATTGLEASQESDNVVEGLVENAEETSESEANGNLPALPYGDLVYSYGDEGEVVSGTFTLKGAYQGYNEDNGKIMIKLEESGDILAFSENDFGTLYLFPSDVTVNIQVTNAGIALGPDHNFPLSEEAKQEYIVRDAKDIPEYTEVLIHGKVDYTEGEKITYEVIEFYDL